MKQKYSGLLGIAEQVEVSPGVWDEIITEQEVIGDMEQRSETLEGGDSVLPRYATTTSVSLLALGVGPRDNSNLRYLTHAGKEWAIATITDEPPKIVLYFGEEYNGPLADRTAGETEGN